MNSGQEQGIATYYLEMLSPDQQQRSTADPAALADLSLVECLSPQYQYNRFLYQLVGEQWQWTEKNQWSNQQWQDYAEAPNLRTWVAYHRGTPAGYFELQSQDQGNIEIVYFGLASAFIGRGYGSYLLDEAISQAWQWQAKRVWVHTCSLDHPHALANYQKRGMTLYDTTRE